MSTMAPASPPPVVRSAAPDAGAAVGYRSGRPSMRVWAVPRPSPRLDPHTLRRFWVAALGPGPVEDLLRLIAAGNHRTAVRRPLFLSVLLEVGVAAVHRDVIWVPSSLPPLPGRLLRSLPPGRRAHYLQWITAQTAGEISSVPGG